MITVGFDTRSLSSAHRFRGVGFYTKRLLKALKKVSGRGIYKNIQIKKIDLSKKYYQLSTINYQLIHCPYFDPFFLTFPSVSKIPIVVTVHDLIPIKYPRHFPKGAKGTIKWFIQKNLLKKSQAIITDSGYWQREISKIINYPQEKIYSIPLAASEEFKVIEDKKFLKKVRKKYNLPKTFILHVGDLNWNKNIPGLLKAIVKANEVKLVLVGKAFLEKEGDKIDNLIKNLRLGNKVVKLGFVPTKDLAVIHNLAKVYCQPSFAEGFGLPVLEAMQAGCPVITSNVSSMPEIVGEAGILIDPQKSEEIADAVQRVCSNELIQQSMKKKGLEQAKKFSWEKTAKMTLKVYRKVVNRPRSF